MNVILRVYKISEERRKRVESHLPFSTCTNIAVAFLMFSDLYFQFSLAGNHFIVTVGHGEGQGGKWEGRLKEGGSEVKRTN